MELSKQLQKFGILPLAVPGKSDAYIFVVLEIGLVAVDDNGVVAVSSQPPQQFEEPLIFLNGNGSTYRQW
jgi:hypothetical protein